MHSNTTASKDRYSIKALRCADEAIGYIRIEVSTSCEQKKDPAEAGTTQKIKNTDIKENSDATENIDTKGNTDATEDGDAEGNGTFLGSITILDRSYDKPYRRNYFTKSIPAENRPASEDMPVTGNASASEDTPVTSFSDWVELCWVTLPGKAPILVPPLHSPHSVSPSVFSPEAARMAAAACAHLFHHGVKEIGFFTEDMEEGDLYAKALGFELYDRDNSGWYPVYYYRKCPEGNPWG